MPTEPAALLNLSVHSLPSPAAAGRTRRGRWQMLAILLVCAVPVVGSYLAYFGGMRPQGKTNYSDLIQPPHPLPDGLPLQDLAGKAVAPATLRGQWLLVVVSGGACDAGCERRLWLQRQLHESLGRDKERVDKVWLVDDATAPLPKTLAAIGADPAARPAGLVPATVLRVPAAALARWLAPADGHALEDHVYVVDPQGDWMMRAPADVDPPRFKRDIEKLLRVSAGWDTPGR